MYAYRRLYVKQYSFLKPEERYTVQITCGGKPVAGIDLNRISHVDEEVMCWRKANHIHAWFVDNVQSGRDDCGEYVVEDEDLRELLKACKRIITATELVDGTVYAGAYWAPAMTKAEERRVPGKVIKDAIIAAKLLPTRAGCFFGSLEYDEDYLNDVIATRDWATRMLADSKAGVPGEIYYHSSW